MYLRLHERAATREASASASVYGLQYKTYTMSTSGKLIQMYTNGSKQMLHPAFSAPTERALSAAAAFFTSKIIDLSLL